MGQWRNQRKNLKIPRDKWKWKYNLPKHRGCNKNSFKTEIHNNTVPATEIRKISNKQPNITPKNMEKKEQTSSKVYRRKEIKLRVDINEIETSSIK